MQTLGTYEQSMPVAYAGLIALMGNSNQATKTEWRLNSGGQAKQTIGTVTIGGTYAEGETASITVVGTSPTTGSFTKTVTATGDAAPTVTEMATALVTALNADDDINDVLVASNSAGVITLTVREYRTNPITSVSGSEASSSGTITASPTVTSYTDAAAIPFGYAVMQDSADGDNVCRKFTSAASGSDIVLGVATCRHMGEQAYPNTTATTPDTWKANESVEIMRAGLIWVPVAAAVTKGTQPYIIDATGQLTANGAGSATAMASALYRTTTTAAGLALVELNLP